MLEMLGWTIVILLFMIGMAGAIYPILPSVVAVYGAFFIYGLFFGFGEFTFWFWFAQTFIFIVIFVADYLVSALGIQKFGGSKAALWGSTIGLLVGPFVIPVAGFVLGPFLGAVIGEIMSRAPIQKALHIGWISVISLFSSIVVKIFLQAVMIGIFLFYVL
jgi:uncharacterized protein YqgC (DUF456 family)